jgi:hypothetical protein
MRGEGTQRRVACSFNVVVVGFIARSACGNTFCRYCRIYFVLHGLFRYLRAPSKHDLRLLASYYARLKLPVPNNNTNTTNEDNTTTTIADDDDNDEQWLIDAPFVRRVLARLWRSASIGRIVVAADDVDNDDHVRDIDATSTTATIGGGADRLVVDAIVASLGKTTPSATTMASNSQQQQQQHESSSSSSMTAEAALVLALAGVPALCKLHDLRRALSSSSSAAAAASSLSVSLLARAFECSASTARLVQRALARVT